ncbi:hypothetical protein WDW89_15660 [Deltaproteobacteria bacterium TL4]
MGIYNKDENKYSVLERTKVTKKMSEYIDKIALKEGWSHSRVLREALDHYAEYEETRALHELKELKDEVSMLNDYVRAVGKHQEQWFAIINEKLSKSSP